MVATPNRKMQNVLKISMALTAAYVVATFVFGLRAHSLALISEAGHNVSDLLAILLSFVAALLPGARPATAQKTLRLPARRSPRRLRQRPHPHRPLRLDQFPPPSTA